jgi:HEAT repeat protein
MRGLHYVQLEPVWGKPVDTAASLRGTCAHALVACDIDTTSLLQHFVDLLADSETTVRAEVARAIGQVGGEGILLLRLKALTSDKEAVVIGECFQAILWRQHRDGVAFVSRFLESEKLDIQFEAVSALAASREPEALEVVKRLWTADISTALRRGIVFSCGESPLPEAADFLLSLVDARHIDVAALALAALAASRFNGAVRERALQAAENSADPTIIQSFRRAFEAA